jgi:5-methylcytosine-specific restriction endonuclease McrA
MKDAKKSLWKVFSEYIRRRDKGVCISCGKRADWKTMDAGHYIPKTSGLALYFDERNVNCQCTSCNRWMHGNLSAYAIALIKKYGPDILEELDSQRNVIKKISEDEYKGMIEIYKNKIKSL